MYLACKASNNSYSAESATMVNKGYAGDQLIFDTSIDGQKNITHCYYNKLKSDYEFNTWKTSYKNNEI